MKKLIPLLLVMFIGFTTLLPAAYVQAADPVEIIDPVCRDEKGNLLPANRRPEVCDNGDDQSLSPPEDNPIIGPNGVLTKAIDILSLIVGVACVLVIIISGLRFIVSAGDSNAISSARHSLIYAVVGLLIVIAARILVLFILSVIF